MPSSAIVTQLFSLLMRVYRTFPPVAPIIRPEHPDVQVVADKMTKVTWFVVRQLTETEQKRYFPVWPTTQKLEE
jgi:hypothetical protein